MKIIVIGGTGLIGKQLISDLRSLGNEAVAASPSTGVNSFTGAGLAAALAGAEVVVDVTNSPSFEDKAVLNFFETSTRNVLAASAHAGVKHFVALSIVGVDRLPASGYMRAKIAQESLIVASSVPWTIVRATQFFEFIGTIGAFSAVGDTVSLTPAKLQPIAAADVAAALAEVAVAPPVNARIEIAGPDKIGLDELVRRLFAASKDPRQVITDPAALYFGAALDDRSLTPGSSARLGPTRFDEWLRRASL
jgi:uncharacterized protein YbjT (DUF2867 family)